VGDPLGRAETGKLMARHGFTTRKALGQHFLVDPNTVHRIVEVASVGPGDHVVEVGAGAGTLTRALAETGAKVFTRIHVHFIVSGEGLAEKQVARAVKLSAEKYCSASLMLGKTAEITHDFELVTVGETSND